MSFRHQIEAITIGKKIFLFWKNI